MLFSSFLINFQPFLSFRPYRKKSQKKKENFVRSIKYTLDKESQTMVNKISIVASTNLSSKSKLYMQTIISFQHQKMPQTPK